MVEGSVGITCVEQESDCKKEWQRGRVGGACED